MESVVSLLARLFGAPGGQPPSAHEHPRLRVRLSPDGDDAPILLAISRLIRLLRLPPQLELFRRTEPTVPEGSDGADEHQHPDAAAVLQVCRERHPHWSLLTIKGAWLVYRVVLKERGEAAVQRHLALEPWATIRRVCAAIDALRPKIAEDEDDALVVWAKLVWRDPKNGAYVYDESQIHLAWIETVSARRRIDYLGTGGRGHNAVAFESDETEAWIVAHASAPWQSLADTWTVVALCASQGATIERYVHSRLMKEGDWPGELLDRLEPPDEGDCADETTLSKDQERRARAKLAPRVDRLLDRA